MLKPKQQWAKPNRLWARFLDGREWLAPCRVFSPLQLTAFEKNRFIFFCFELGSTSTGKFHVPARCACWLQGISFTPEAYKEKNSKFLQIPLNEFLQMKTCERFSAMKFL
jgi:hypothetical protein